MWFLIFCGGSCLSGRNDTKTRKPETQRRTDGHHMTDRAFIAIEIPEDVMGAIVSSRRGLESTLPRARWVRGENQHLTLRFLGEVSSRELGALAARLSSVLEGVPSVTVTLGGAGFFPSASRPRVAWVGGKAKGIDSVLDAVEEAVSMLQLETRGKSWALHLTQARLVKSWPPGAVRTFLDWGQALHLPPFQAREVVVFTSDLRPGGAVYTRFERIRLA